MEDYNEMNNEQNSTPKGSNNGTVVIGWIERISDVIQNKGLQNLILTIMVMFLVVFVGYIAYNPSSLIKRIENIQTKQHTEAIAKRLKNEPSIRESLTDLKIELNADRVFILETHNGGNNLAKLPFLYVDLTYAEPCSSLTWLEEEYKNVRLSRYPFATYLYEQVYWYGKIDDILAKDPELYYRLQKEEVTNIGFILMYGEYNPSGVLGVVYTEHQPEDSVYIQKMMMKYSNKIGKYLTNDIEE